MVKYRAFANSILPYEVIKETAGKVTYIAKGGYETLEWKNTDSIVWRDTFEECKEELIRREIEEIRILHEEIEFHKEKILMLHNLKNENQL